MGVAYGNYFPFVVENGRFKHDFVAIIIKLHDFGNDAATRASRPESHYALSRFCVFFPFEINVFDFFIAIDNLFE